MADQCTIKMCRIKSSMSLFVKPEILVSPSCNKNVKCRKTKGTKMATCKTLAKGDVEVPGYSEPVFARQYKSHKRGDATFYNNRRGGKATVYSDTLELWPSGADKPRQCKSAATLNKALVKLFTDADKAFAAAQS
jgi:hypothetical protein